MGGTGSGRDERNAFPVPPSAVVQPVRGIAAAMSRALTRPFPPIAVLLSALLRFFAHALALCALFGLALVRPALAQSILRDAETEAMLRDATMPLIRAAGLDEKNVQVILINDPSINAFVAGGQIVWIHSGLITSADNVNQVLGVVAHELGHIEGGHVIRSGEGIQEATGIQILSMVLGAAAIAAGSGQAGMGIMGLGQQAAINRYLAFSRTQEASADAAAVRYMSKAGISCRGFLEFFAKLQNQEYRLYLNQEGYGTTHPFSAQRIATLKQACETDPAWTAKTDAALDTRFARIKAKLLGFVGEATRTLKLYPPSDKSVPAHYARAYAYHKTAYPAQAVAEADALLAIAPNDPYFLELKGQVLLESGKPAQALAPLRAAVQETGGQPLIATLLGHALFATEDKANFDEAEQVLRAALTRDPENPFGWYVLGNIYTQKGDAPRAALASAEQFQLDGQDGMALRSAQTAMAGIAPGTPDYLRAQDIAMVSRAAMEKGRKR
jgi:predicted Zn-dependent protease